MGHIGGEPFFLLKLLFQLFQHLVEGACQLVELILSFIQPDSLGQIPPVRIRLAVADIWLTGRNARLVIRYPPTAASTARNGKRTRAIRLMAANASSESVWEETPRIHRVP